MPIPLPIVINAAYLFTELLTQGVKMSEILSEMNNTGKLTPELKAQIKADFSADLDGWDSAPGPSD